MFGRWATRKGVAGSILLNARSLRKFLLPKFLIRGVGLCSFRISKLAKVDVSQKPKRRREANGKSKKGGAP